MRIQITGRNVTIPDDVAQYAREKFGKLEKYFHNIMDAQVIFSQQKNNRVCEVTIHASGKIIRAENKGTEFKESIDIVAERLERQIRRYKEKFLTRKKEQAPDPMYVKDEEFESPKIVRVKEISVKQMMFDEAIMQMELLSQHLQEALLIILQHMDLSYL